MKSLWHERFPSLVASGHARTAEEKSKPCATLLTPKD
jgi:hypothetical protein